MQYLPTCANGAPPSSPKEDLARDSYAQTHSIIQQKHFLESCYGALLLDASIGVFQCVYEHFEHQEHPPSHVLGLLLREACPYIRFLDSNLFHYQSAFY